MPKAPKHIKTKEPQELGGFDRDKLKPLCSEYAELRALKAACEAELTRINTELSLLSDQLVAKFRAIGQSSAKMDGIGIFFIANTVRPSVVDEAKLFADLKRRRMGDLIKQTVHAKILEAALKEVRANGEPDFAGIATFEQTQIRLRKS